MKTPKPVTSLLEGRAKLYHIFFEAKKLVGSFPTGNYRSFFRGRGLEFKEVRPYSETDDMRFIDWNVTARLGGSDLYTKEFEEERELVSWVAIDLSSSMNAAVGQTSVREAAFQVLAALSLIALKNQDKIGIIAFSDQIEQVYPPVKSKKRIYAEITTLFSMRSSGRHSSLLPVIDYIKRQKSRHEIFFLVSDFRFSSKVPGLDYLCRYNEVVAVQIENRFSTRPPALPLVWTIDPETQEKFPLYTEIKGVFPSYSNFWEYHFVKWRFVLEGLGISQLSIDMEKSPIVALLEFFRRWRRRV